MSEKLTAIQTQLDEWDRAYRDGKPLVPDAKYDGTKRVYLGLGGKPYLTRTEAGAIVHRTPMGSLAVADTLADLRARFAGSCGVLVATAKGDGLPISCVYRFGRLVSAGLRSDDGTTGTDVTDAARQFVAPVLGARAGDPYFEIRGEVVLKTSVWKKHFKDMKNPRNGANGIVKRGASADAKHLSFLPFDSTTLESANYEWTLHALKGEANDCIPSFGLFHLGSPKKPDGWDDAVWNKVRGKAVELTDEVLAELYVKLKALDIWTDGIVFRVISNSEYAEAGASGPDPRLAVAFKYPPETMETTVTGADWRTGATGQISPRAIIKPVMVSGTTVTYATLSNFGKIAALDMAIGDTVELRKSGEIIPEILKVTERPETRVPIVKPEKCSCCGASTEMTTLGEGEEEEEGAHLACTNLDCWSRRASQLRKWCKARGILGMGDVASEAIAKASSSNHELYNWGSDSLGQLLGSEVTAHKLVTQLAGKGRNVGLRDFLASISIPRVAQNKSLKLADEFITLDAVVNAPREAIDKVVGKKHGVHIHGYLQARGAVIWNFAKVVGVLDHVKDDKPVVDTKLPAIALTGTLYKDRDAIAADINASGKFQFVKSVTRKTKYLVAEDAGGNSAKLQDAREKGVEVIDGERLQELLRS